MFRIVTSPWLIKTCYVSLHVYGLSVALGLLFAVRNILKDSLLQKYNLIDTAITIVTYSILNGWLGARILWFYEYWDEVTLIDFFTVTTPGFSLLGAVIAVVYTVAWLMQKVPSCYRLLLVDRLALYALLVIASGRIGCFFTGCCYGTETTIPWSICYVHSDVAAPLDLMIHPVQLYSAGILFFLFGVCYFLQERFQPGQLFLYSLQGILLERLVVDFFRDGRTLVIGSLSLHQVVALSCLLGIYLILFLSNHVQRK